jgi:acetyltransferase
MTRRNLHFLFRPASTAVIGASTREGSVGRALFSNILMNGYTGVVYPVNMKAKSVLGVKAYPSILDIPDAIDLAILIVPALAVPATLAECGQKGIKAAIVISAGFKELGPVGAKLERNVREKAERYGIALIGPNCFGMINTDPAVRLNTTFGRVMPRPGNIAFMSQSGAIGVNALEYAESEEVGLSKFVSIGNKADINENDLLEFLRDDDETDVIAFYLEDLVNPKEFMRVAREVTSNPRRPKPILAIKAGRTSEGAKAASSHTGALAGSDEAYNAFFDQARIIRVETINDLFAKAAALAYQPPPRGHRVGILTNAGGVGIMATDACVSNGLELAKLSEATKNAMKEHVPATASVTNPVDVIGDADEKRYGAVLRLLVADDNVDSVIPIWTPTLMAEAVDIAGIIAEVGASTDKPVLACIQTMGDSSAIRRALLKDRIPHYQFPESAARALATMTRFADWSRRPQGDTTRFSDTDQPAVREIVDRALARTPVFLSEPEGHDILRAYGLPVPECRLVNTGEEALAAAEAIGFPVVLKIVSPDILHKTEFGGVRVNITDAACLADEFAALLRTVGERRPGADIWGVLVQRMADRGTETILGMKRDPQFGPLLMFGLGGVMVEVLKDVVFRVAPISDESAQSMVSGIKAHKLLEAFRGDPPRDRDKLKECLMRLSQLVVDFDEFDEIDLNPLRVYAEGKGAVILDARFLLR